MLFQNRFPGDIVNEVVDRHRATIMDSANSQTVGGKSETSTPSNQNTSQPKKSQRTSSESLLGLGAKAQAHLLGIPYRSGWTTKAAETARINKQRRRRSLSRPGIPRQSQTPTDPLQGEPDTSEFTVQAPQGPAGPPIPKQEQPTGVMDEVFSENPRKKKLYEQMRRWAPA